MNVGKSDGKEKMIDQLERIADLPETSFKHLQEALDCNEAMNLLNEVRCINKH